MREICLRGRDPQACDVGRGQDGTREAATGDPHSLSAGELPPLAAVLEPPIPGGGRGG